MRGWIGRSAAAGALAGLLGGAPAHGADLRNVGVADCASSTCHGATQAFAGRPIGQDEYLTWLRRDRHSRAFQTLESADSRGIVERLGWPAATQAPGCLACHAHAPPETARGPRFQVSDGIGCEACHGPAELWLAPHVKGIATAEAKIGLGMTPAWDPAARGALCVSCHQGDASRPMTHAIMAAGHPPLLFELDTFMALMPRHHVVDADYRERKGADRAADQWLAGQLAAAESFLETLRTRHGAGRFPELALYDCEACHHRIDDARGRVGRAPGQPAGTVPFADQALVLVGAWLGAVDPALGRRWSGSRSALYAADDGGALRAAADEALALLRSDLWPRSRQPLEPAQVRATLQSILRSGAQAHAGDLAFAQQAAMAAQVLLAALGEDDPALLRGRDALFASVQVRAGFHPDGFAAASAALADRLRR